MDENVLQHYGVLGMKWGVRRTPAQLARARKERSGNSESSGAKKTTKTATKGKSSPSSSNSKKKLSDMSDDELKNEIGRLQLEKTYRDLMKSNYPPKKTLTDRGKEIATDIITNSVKNVGTQLVTYAMGTAVNKALKGVFNDSSVVNPKKGQKDK